MMRIAWQGRELVLLADKAAFLADTRSLVIADVHLGKADAFRASGLPVPAAVTAETLRRLDRALDRVDARRLIVLGDLLHAPDGRTRALDEAVSAWRARRSGLEIVLVRGNHDRHAGDPPSGWDVVSRDEPFREPPWAFRHDAAAGETCLSGHVHPAVVVRGRDGMRTRTPCFWVRPNAVILPAFGGFTGSRTIRPDHPHDRVFVAAGGMVVDVTPLTKAPASWGGHFVP